MNQLVGKIWGVIMFQIILKQLRKNRDLSQTALANEIGVRQSTVAMWESGQNYPEFKTLEKLAVFFNVTLDYLIGRDDSIKKEPATNNGDGLDDEKLKLLVDLFQSAPEYLQDAALAVLRSEAARQQDEDKSNEQT